MKDKTGLSLCSRPGQVSQTQGDHGCVMIPEIGAGASVKLQNEISSPTLFPRLRVAWT